MVILIADAAWMAYRYTRQDSWKNVDVLLVGVKKYSLDLSEYLHPTRLSAHNFQLTQDLCRSYNATGITEDIYIPQNIQLMQALRPDLQEIAVIGDCQFFGIYSTLLVKKYLQEYPSDLKFTFLDGRFLSTNTLYERLQHLSPNTGTYTIMKKYTIIFANWLRLPYSLSRIGGITISIISEDIMLKVSITGFYCRSWPSGFSAEYRLKLFPSRAILNPSVYISMKLYWKPII